MSTIYRAIGDTATGWGITPAAAVAALENILPEARLSSDCLVEPLTDSPPPDSLEVIYICPPSKRR